MKKIFLSIFIFSFSLFFLNDNVSAYREDDRYINFDLSSMTKESFVFSDSTNNYFDDLVKIDNYLKEQGVHYNIWLLKDSNNKFSAFRVYVNRFFDNGTPYNNYSITYYTFDSDRIFLNYENTTSYSSLNTSAHIDTVSKLDELITSINAGTNPFTPGSKNTGFGGILHPYARDHTCNNQFLGDYKCRTTQEFYVPFSTSDTVIYGDVNGYAYKLSYISPKNDFYLIEKGHTMPLLIDYIDTKIINPYDFSRYFNDFGKPYEQFLYEDEIIKELKRQKLKYAIVHANTSVTPNDFYPDYNYISNMYGIYICDDSVTEIKIYQEMSSTSGSGANKVQYYTNRFLPNTGYSSCRFKLIDTQAKETELYNSKDFTTGFNTLTGTLFQPAYQTSVYENSPNRSYYKFFYSSNMNIKLNGMYHEIHINDVQYKNGDRYPIYDEIIKSDGIDYMLKETFNTTLSDKFNLKLTLDKLLIEEKKKFNFKVETGFTGANNDNIPSTPIFNLYKVVGNNLILVENDNNIFYDWLEYEETDKYYLEGYIEFADGISYVNDYVLEIKFSNIYNTIINVYDDSPICSWTGNYPFLDGYTKYTYKGTASGYAISYIDDFKGKIIVESKYLDEPYNFSAGYYAYETKTKKELLEFKDYIESGFSYLDFTIEYFNTSKDDNHILTVFKNIETDESFDFYVPSQLTVSEIYVKEINEDGTPTFEFIMNTPNGEGTFNEDINYNFGEEKFIETFTSAVNFFVTPIKEIFKLIAIFYNNIATPFKMFFVALFGLVISVFIVRFLL